MGTSGSKPDWYPGEPADVFKSDPCLCSQAPQPAGKMGEEADARSPGPFRGSGGGIRALKASPQRDITSLPVVSLTDMQYIANGAFCAVYACKYRGWSVVAKRVRHDLPLSERKAALANLWTEYDCLRNLRHPNVIDVYGMCRVRCRDDYDDWNEKDVCLLVEQLAFGTVGHLFGTIVPTEKNLASAMARSRKMKMVPFRCRLHRALELAQALEYMHGGSGMGSMMHRDIKSVNVGFAQNGSLKLMDFGLSKKTPAGSAVDDTYKMTGEVGSYRYMAPELVKHEPYNSKVDIYSWAILSWEMLAIDKPYSGIGESTFVKKVVIGGDRPGFRKSWPDRLCKLLTAAWHADHTKRPPASEIVAVLKIIEAELSSKEQRRPSHEAVSVATPGGGSGGGSASASGSASRRRHSWTQVSSTGRPTALSLTRLPSGSSTKSGPENGNSTNKNGGGPAAQVPPLSSSASSPGPPTQATTKKKSTSLPVPLPQTSSASFATTSTARRVSLRWLPARRTSSSSSAASAPAPPAEVTSALDEVGGGSRGRCSGSAGGEDRKGSLETIVAGTAHGGRTRREGADVDDIDVDAQEGAPEWTTSAADAAAAAAAAAAIRADVGGGCGDGRRCQLRQALISQRELITDALARETEGLLSSDGPARASSPRAAETTTSTKAAPEPVAEGRRNPDKPRKTGDGSGKGEDTPGGLSSSSSGSSSGSSCSSSAAGSQTAAKTRKVSPTAPAATVAEKAARGAPVVPDVLRESRRNSGLGKLWPSTSSSGRRQDQGDAADAASAAEEEEVGAPPRAVTPGAVWVNGGGIGLPIGKAATATVSSE